MLKKIIFLLAALSSTSAMAWSIEKAQEINEILKRQALFASSTVMERWTYDTHLSASLNCMVENNVKSEYFSKSRFFMRNVFEQHPQGAIPCSDLEVLPQPYCESVKAVFSPPQKTNHRNYIYLPKDWETRPVNYTFMCRLSSTFPTENLMVLNQKISLVEPLTPTSIMTAKGEMQVIKGTAIIEIPSILNSRQEPYKEPKTVILED